MSPMALRPATLQNEAQPRNEEGRMEALTPSRTAQGAAMHRAAHQLIDQPPVFADPLGRSHHWSRSGRATSQRAATGTPRDRAGGLRAFIAMRSRFAEDGLAAAVRPRRAPICAPRCGARYVRLSGTNASALPALPFSRSIIRQRRRGSANGSPRLASPLPPTSFMRRSISNRKLWPMVWRGRGSIFPGRRFSRGSECTPYLSQATGDGHAEFHRDVDLRAGSEVVFDYAQPVEALDAAQRANFEAMAERVASAGEPFRSFFDAGGADQRSLCFGIFRRRRFRRGRTQCTLFCESHGRAQIARTRTCGASARLIEGRAMTMLFAAAAVFLGIHLLVAGHAVSRRNYRCDRRRALSWSLFAGIAGRDRMACDLLRRGAAAATDPLLYRFRARREASGHSRDRARICPGHPGSAHAQPYIAPPGGSGSEAGYDRRRTAHHASSVPVGGRDLVGVSFVGERRRSLGDILRQLFSCFRSLARSRSTPSAGGRWATRGSAFAAKTSNIPFGAVSRAATA